MPGRCSADSDHVDAETSQFVMAGLVAVPARQRAGCPAPAISLRRHGRALLIEIAGTRKVTAVTRDQKFV